MGQDLYFEKFVEASTPKFGEILRNDSQMLNEQMSQLVDKKQVETCIRTKKISQECWMSSVE